jgi:hypothetical protein
LGHELVQRRDLLPHQPDHPRADEWSYRLQLGTLEFLQRPIISLQWRRITFLHTTGDRFQDAVELNDLFLDGEGYVDRAFTVLKDGRFHAQSTYTIEQSSLIKEPHTPYGVVPSNVQKNYQPGYKSVVSYAT